MNKRHYYLAKSVLYTPLDTPRLYRNNTLWLSNLKSSDPCSLHRRTMYEITFIALISKTEPLAAPYSQWPPRVWVFCERVLGSNVAYNNDVSTLTPRICCGASYSRCCLGLFLLYVINSAVSPWFTALKP